MKQKHLLDLYSDYLLASFGATTATGLSQLLEGQVSHDQVSRYLSGTKKTSADLWLTVKPLVRQVQSAEGVLIIDDSIEEKPYTDENEIVCWHYDHTTGQQVKGINFITALYHSLVSQPGGEFASGLSTDCQNRVLPRQEDTETETAQSHLQESVLPRTHSEGGGEPDSLSLGCAF
jgi:hypothetical protein